MTTSGDHVPVLYEEVLAALDPQPGNLYIDGTLGGGGHTRGILERGGRVLAFDWDFSTIEITRKTLHNYSTQVQYHHANYADMAHWAPQYGFAAVDGVLLDLGLSSRQLDDPRRGFSYRFDGPLDMRFDRREGDAPSAATAAELLNHASAGELANLLYRYGEIRQSHRLAQAIIDKRPLHTTGDLRAAIEESLGGGHRFNRLAAQVFQAVRIAVNRELEAVEKGVLAGVDLLKPGGRIAVITFHSLEDRLVKQIFRRLSDPYYDQPKEKLFVDEQNVLLNRITRKPITPTVAEMARNPRSRSAKLRVAEKRQVDA